MKFTDFLNEALSTAHGKVEMALRELGLKYEVDEENTKKVFWLQNDYYVESFNSGKVALGKIKVKGSIDSFTTFDFNKIRELTVKMVEPHVKEITAGSKAINKQKETA